MTKKTWIFVMLAAVLGVLYVIYFTDWFRPKTVQIFHSLRQGRNRTTAGEIQLMFGLSRQLPLNEIEVVTVSDWQTNRHPLPLWHLTSDSNSVPVKTFAYGQNIRGLRSTVPGIHAKALETNVAYRLTVKSGAIRGEHIFELK